MNFNILAYVPASKVSVYKNFKKEAINDKNFLMLFPGDQKVEHLNNTFYGKDIRLEDNFPEHMFQIVLKEKIDVLTTQFGLIPRCGWD